MMHREIEYHPPPEREDNPPQPSISMYPSLDDVSEFLEDMEIRIHCEWGWRPLEVDEIKQLIQFIRKGER